MTWTQVLIDVSLALYHLYTGAEVIDHTALDLTMLEDLYLSRLAALFGTTPSVDGL